MESENKVCQNCKLQFIIEPADFDFYRKINVPPPTFCPQCRFQRRLATFNLRTLYKRKCDLCRQDKISMSPPNPPTGGSNCPNYKVYCPACWWSDEWDPRQYGRDYDFSKPFFEQYRKLWREVPLLGLSIDLTTAETSPYNNHAGHLKNCYLLFHSDFTEDSAYGTTVIYGKNLLDCTLSHACELSYDCKNNFKNNRCIGADHTNESLECIFTRDCVNCQNCFASANLRGKKYYIFNKPHTKEEYFKEIKKWNLGSYAQYQEIKKLAEEHWKKFPPKPRWDDFSANCTGNYIFNSKNCKECFEVSNAEDSKYIFMALEGPVKDCYDVSSWGNNMELCYEGCVVGENVSGLKFCQESGLTLQNAEYCKLSTGGSEHFGCVSMKKGKFAILNKIYPENEYRKLRERIIAHMDELPYISHMANGESLIYRYGEFFPMELSPFPYNDSMAQEFFPLAKNEIEKLGLVWSAAETREHAVTKLAADFPDHIQDAPLNILAQVVGCASCRRGFRIIQMELDFLKSMNLPLPRECPTCRIGKKFGKWIKNLRIFKRICGKCGTEFETAYPEDEVEYILCKKCYLEEII